MPLIRPGVKTYIRQAKKGKKSSAKKNWFCLRCGDLVAKRKAHLGGVLVLKNKTEVVGVIHKKHALIFSGAENILNL